MKVIFCDVDQGDSILIQQGFFQVLIDSGRDDRVLGCLGSFLPVWDRELELVIVTHADEDHIGFFEEILGFYQAKYLIFSGSPKDTRSTRGLEEAISQEAEEGAFVKRPILGQSVRFSSGGRLTFLEIPEVPGRNLSENDRSVVFLLEYGATRWLFTGDLEAAGEQLLEEKGVLPRVDVLKVGHHGSATSTTDGFLSETEPTVAVISVGADNKYGHPAPSVLERLEKSDVAVLRTDELGHVVLASDGVRVWLESVRRE